MVRSLFTGAHGAVVQVLIAARQRAGLRQEDVAERLGRHQSYVSNIERGQRRVELVEFTELADALGLDPVALFRDIVTAIGAPEDRARSS